MQRISSDIASLQVKFMEAYSLEMTTDQNCNFNPWL